MRRIEGDYGAAGFLKSVRSLDELSSAEFSFERARLSAVPSRLALYHGAAEAAPLQIVDVTERFSANIAVPLSSVRIMLRSVQSPRH